MDILARERLETAIGFFADRYCRKHRQGPSQTEVYKFLAFVEFASIKEVGKPVFGLRYLAMEWGPVPIDFYEEVKTRSPGRFKYFVTVRDSLSSGKSVIRFLPKKGVSYPLDLFSRRERTLLERFAEILVGKGLTARDYSEASHERIKAWRVAYERKPNSVMKYFDEVETEEARERLETWLELKEAFGG